MRRRALRQDDASPSLFPFLAVLICTVGALIVLLVVVVQQARVQAEAFDARPEEDASAVAQLQALQQQRQKYVRRAELLEHERRAGESELAMRRESLAQLDEDRRRLSQALARLDDTDAALGQQGSELQQGIADSQRELAALGQRVDEARQRMRQAESDATGQPQPYALIPYDGPNETRRRPIYLECLQDRVIMQPEGITFHADDFQGRLGPNNPLAAALRATRAYLARGKGMSNYEQAYPLLVVRPDGAEAYAAARAAMRSWDAEFGYELVTADMQLAYPPVDPALAKTLRGIVELARQRQRRAETLAAFPARRSRGNSSDGFRASGHGGFVPSGSASGDDGQQFGFQGSAAGNRFGPRQTSRGSGTLGGTRGSAPGERGLPGSDPRLGPGPGTYSSSSDAYGQSGTDSRLRYGAGGPGQSRNVGTSPQNRAQGYAGASGLGPNGTMGEYPGDAGGPGQAGYAVAGPGGAAGRGVRGATRGESQGVRAPGQGGAFAAGPNTAAGQGPDGARALGPGGVSAPGTDASAGQGPDGARALGQSGASTPGSNARAGQGPDGARGPGQGGASNPGSDARAGQGPDGASGPSQAGAKGTANNGVGGSAATGSDTGTSSGSAAALGGMQGAPSPQAMAQASSVPPLAQSRGRNWALPNSTRGALGITRPLTVVCYSDRLVLRPEHGTSAKAQVIPFRTTTQSAVQPLVDAIWRRVEGWGIAGPNVYWRPELHVTNAPGTELRFAELQALMRESGVTIVRN